MQARGILKTVSEMATPATQTRKMSVEEFAQKYSGKRAKWWKSGVLMARSKSFKGMTFSQATPCFRAFKWR